MAEINREIGLTALIQGLGGDSKQDIIEPEKAPITEKHEVI